MAALTYEQKKRKYFIVFGILTVVTVVELLVAGMKFFPPTINTSVVVFLSLVKAYYVAKVYMHLEYEARMTQWLIFTPLIIAVFYATYLIVDARAHAVHKYQVEAERVYTQEKQDKHAVDSELPKNSAPATGAMDSSEDASNEEKVQTESDVEGDSSVQDTEASTDSDADADENENETETTTDDEGEVEDDAAAEDDWS